MSDIQAVLETFIKSQDDKLKAIEAKTAEAIQKYEGQAQYKTVDQEVKNEVRELTERYKSLEASMIEVAQKQVAGAGSDQAHAKSAAEELVGTEQFKMFQKGDLQRLRVEVKNTVTSTSNTVLPDQRPGIITGDFRPLTVRDILQSVPTTSNMVTELRESSWVNSAKFVSQGATKPESYWDSDPYNVAIETVAHTIKMSNQLMQDAPAVVAYLNTRLRHGLAEKIEQQLISGNGTAPNLSGLIDSGNYTAYTPTSDDLLVDAINRAKYSLWAATGLMPDAVIVNPADWGAMERTRETSGGAYLYGLPGIMAGMNPFGVRVVLSNNVTQGNFIIGNMDQAALVYSRVGAVIELGFVNDDFARNLVTARCEERLGLAVRRPSCIYYGAFSA